MTWWQGIVLGIVQGLTEFLPISSSGHLVVAEQAFGLQTPGVSVEVVLHVGTLLAVLLVYASVLRRIAVGALRREYEAWRYIVLLVVATIPAGLAGVFLEDWFERAFDSLTLVGLNFLITGVILWSTRRPPAGSDGNPSVGGAFGIGVAQALAILPGISRSGTTVSAAIWLGIDPVRAAEFSFLMAIPTIAGAAVLQLRDLSADMAGISPVSMGLGFVASLLSGIVAIRFLIVLLRRRAFHRFAPYCWAIGVVTITWSLLR